MSTLIAKVALLLALWPVWSWNFERLTDKSDEPLGLLALVTLAYFLWEQHKGPEASGVSPETAESSPVATPTSKSETEQTSKSDAEPNPKTVARATPTILALVVLAAYCISILFAPKLIQGVLAVAAICLILPGSSSLSLPCWILAALSLPVVATLSFYLSYPLRVLIGCLAVSMLNMSGFSATLEGTAIFWNSQIVEIDAPCSGIKMLWFAGYFCAALSAFYHLKNIDVLRLCVVSATAAMAANALRVTSLFFLETGAIPYPREWHDFLHQAVGTIVFLVAAGSLLFCAYRLRRSSTAPESTVEPHLPASNQTTTKNALFAAANSRWRTSALLGLCAAAAILPLLGSAGNGTIDSISNNVFPGWPTTFEGAPLRALEESHESKTQMKFAADFPGKIKAFTNGKQTILLRWVAKPTRQLHTSTDCYRGLGYSVKWLPMLIDKDGNRWSTFEAANQEERLLIRERITDTARASWSDVSSWYWAALLQRSAPPWWATTVIQKLP